MTSPNLNRETSEEISSWMELLRAAAPKWIRPGSEGKKGVRPPLFSLNALKERRFLAVPFIDNWAPSLDIVIDLSVLQSRRKIFATGLEIHPNLILSSSTEATHIQELMSEFFNHCIISPRDESFMVINTFLDYWILAGPHSLVEAATGGSIPRAFENFAQSVNVLGRFFEAGPSFSQHVTQLYTHHNRQIVTDGSCS